MSMSATAATQPVFTHQEGLYTIKVEKLGENSYFSCLMGGDDLIWSGSLYGDEVSARHAAIRQYHLTAKDLIADETRIVKINPLLLIPHPKNKLVYRDDEDTKKLYKQLDTDPEVAPYVSEYLALEDGTIISGHRRNYVITEELNPYYIKTTGQPKIAAVPVIVKRYASQAEELEALVKENAYREEKTEDMKLAEAQILMEVEYLRGRERKALAKQKGASVSDEDKGRSIHKVAAQLGFKPTDLSQKLAVDKFIDENVKNATLAALWKKVRTQSTHAAIALRQIWQRDKDREGLTDEHFIRACNLILDAGKSKLNAPNAIAQAKREIAEEKAKSSNGGSTSTPAKGKKDSKAASSTTPKSNNNSTSTTSTGGGAAIADDEDDEDETDGAANASESEATAQESDAELLKEVEGMPQVCVDRWLAASEEQRQTWRLAKDARDIYSDIPSNNRLTKRFVIDKCLQVLQRDEFDCDPYADLTNPSHVPAKTYYTVADDFMKKDGGKWVNIAEGDVYANILWSKQVDSMRPLVDQIESGHIKRLFIVSQSSIVNLPTCQDWIKRHNMAIAEWKGRLEFEPGEILRYDAFFPLSGEPAARVAENNQRYDVTILFYSSDPEDKLRFDTVFSDEALVTFQRDMIATAAIDAKEVLKMPVWVANECVWMGYRLRVQLEDGADGLWEGYLSEDKEGATEEHIETLETDDRMKAYLMGEVMLRASSKAPF